MAEEKSTDYVVKLRVDTKASDEMISKYRRAANSLAKKFEMAPSRLNDKFKETISMASAIGETLNSGLKSSEVTAKNLFNTFLAIEGTSGRIGYNLSKGLQGKIDPAVSNIGAGIADAFQEGIERINRSGGIVKTDKIIKPQAVDTSEIKKEADAAAQTADEVNVSVNRIQQFSKMMNYVSVNHIKDLEEIASAAKKLGVEYEVAKQAYDSYKRSQDEKASGKNIYATLGSPVDLEKAISATSARVGKEAKLLGKSYGDGIQSSKAEATLKNSASLLDRMREKWQSLTVPAVEYNAKIQAAQSKLESLYRAMARLEDKRIPTEQWKELQAEIRQTTKDINDASAFIIGQDEDPNNDAAIIAKKAALEQLYEEEKKLIATDQVWQDMTKTNQYMVLTDQVAQYQARLEELRATSGDTMSPLQQGLANIKTSLSNVGKKIITTFGKTFTSAVKKAGSAVKSFFSTLKKKASDNGILKPLETLTKKFTNLWSMLMTRFKRRLVATMFNDIKGVFVDIANINPQFNEAVSGVVSSARRLGAQLIAILEPVITRLAPIVEKLADVLSVVADKVAQFSANVFGFDLYTKAEKGNYDFAASMDEAASSASNATKKTKEYENTVLGFDQLNKLNGSSTDSADSTTTQLERLATQASAWNDIAKSIWDAYKNGDWENMGKNMATGLNYLFGNLGAKFGWDLNAEKITQKLKNFTTVLNSFVKNVNAEQIGFAIGDILNTLINSLDYLLNDPDGKIDFSTLGTKIGQLLTSTLTKINWTGVGRVLAGALRGLGDVLRGALTATIKDDKGNDITLGTAIGNALHDMLDGAVDMIDPEHFSDVIAAIVNALNDVIIAITSDPELFGTLGTKLAESFNLLLDKIDQNKANTAFKQVATSLGKLFANFFTGIDWSSLGTFIGSVVGGDAGGALLTGLVGALLGNKIGIGGLGGALAALAIGSNLGDGQGSFFSDVGNAISSVVSALETIADTIVSIAEFLGIKKKNEDENKNVVQKAIDYKFDVESVENSNAPGIVKDIVKSTNGELPGWMRAIVNGVDTVLNEPMRKLGPLVGNRVEWFDMMSKYWAKGVLTGDNELLASLPGSFEEAWQREVDILENNSKLLSHLEDPSAETAHKLTDEELKYWMYSGSVLEDFAKQYGRTGDGYVSGEGMTADTVVIQSRDVTADLPDYKDVNSGPSDENRTETIVTTPVNVNYNGQNLFSFMLKQFKNYEKMYDAAVVQ